MGRPDPLLFPRHLTEPRWESVVNAFGRRWAEAEAESEQAQEMAEEFAELRVPVWDGWEELVSVSAAPASSRVGFDLLSV